MELLEIADPKYDPSEYFAAHCDWVLKMRTRHPHSSEFGCQIYEVMGVDFVWYRTILLWMTVLDSDIPEADPFNPIVRGQTIYLRFDANPKLEPLAFDYITSWVVTGLVKKTHDLNFCKIIK